MKTTETRKNIALGLLKCDDLFRFLVVLAAVAALATAAFGQAGSIQRVDALPAACTISPKSAEIIYKNTDPRGFYSCMAANTWSAMVSGPDLSFFGNSMSTAVSAIGATKADLIISADTSVPASVTVPKNIRLVVTNGAQISVSPGKTLTVNTLNDPGTIKFISLADATAHVVFAAGAIDHYNVAWWAGNTPGADITTGLTESFANVSQSGGLGGIVTVPQGTWNTTGNLTIPSWATLKGTTIDGDAQHGTVIKLTNASSTYIFKVGNSFRHISLRDLTLDVAGITGANAFRTEGTAPNGGIGLEFSRVTFHGLGTGSAPQTYLHSTDSAWEIEQISFRQCEWLTPPNTSAIKIDTPNNSITFDQPIMGLGAGSVGFDLVHAGAVVVNNPTILGAVAITLNDTVQRTITQASITSGTKNLSIVTGTFKQDDVGQKVVIAGKLNSYITDVLTATTATVHDNATSTAANSSMTVYRTAFSTGMAKAAFWLKDIHANLTITGGQDEALQYYLINDIPEYNGVIQLINNSIQAPIQLNFDAAISSTGNRYFSNTFADAAGAEALISSVGDFVNNQTVYGRNIVRARLWGPHLGTSRMMPRFDLMPTGLLRQGLDAPLEIKYGNQEWAPAPLPAEPVLSVGSAFDKQLLRLGYLDPGTNEFVYYYDIKRDLSTGHMTFAGNQTGFTGYDFDSSMSVKKTFSTPTMTAMPPSSTPTINAALGNVFTLTPREDETISIAGMLPGQSITLIILTEGVRSRTLTFGAGFKTTGTLSTGTVSGKYFLMKFFSNGTVVLEESRTTAM